ncbi:hypothetical protein, partial [Pseudomonas syringae group genomosp. 7]|uniref:hypothetical protein n=1 Tax=Pseudomonas syringae group genomosp. 7 TaxID=251699 RepID=UPI00377015E4
FFLFFLFFCVVLGGVGFWRVLVVVVWGFGVFLVFLWWMFFGVGVVLWVGFWLGDAGVCLVFVVVLLVLVLVDWDEHSDLD